ncbi:uncharacterized protein [Miscanthus floridulus]|uniref:uncharacterized protein n=1 Tax=Miscanthus floridulus TaxID=154761 RepID=UPI003458F501
MCVYICMLQGNGGNIPKFGEWKTTDGGSLYTMYFENARKRRNNMPTWGQWNESNSGVGAQQYTLVFDQGRRGVLLQH